MQHLATQYFQERHFSHLLPQELRESNWLAVIMVEVIFQQEKMLQIEIELVRETHQKNILGA